MNEPETKAIRDLKPGDKLYQFLIIRKLELKTKKNGDPYLLMEFGDHSGRIPATFWDDPTAKYNHFQVGHVVKLQGTITEYNQSLQLSVDRIRNITPEEKVNILDFVPQPEFDTSLLIKKLHTVKTSVKNKYLSKLIEKIFTHPVYQDAFSRAPGGKLWHHAYLGGLLEHTLSVIAICEKMAALYSMIDRDLLVTGALLHDIGKVEEYNYDQGFIEYSDEGRLWGHISIGAQRIRTIIEEIEREDDFPVELKKNIIHLILSHQGKLEHGSPVVPATLEAMILYYADEMDSKANALIQIIEREKKPGKNWSKFIPLLERFLYLGKDAPDLNKKSSMPDRDDNMLTLFDNGENK